MPVVSWDETGLIDPGQSERGSHHSMSLNLCARKSAAIAELKIDTGSPATSLGSVMHCVLAHAVCEDIGLNPAWHPGPSIPLPPMAAAEAYVEKHRVSVDPPTWEWIERARHEALACLNNNFPTWRPVAIERVMRAGLMPNPAWEWGAWIKKPGILHTQRFDLVIESGGLIWIIDWKTTYSADRARTLEEHYMSLQMLSAAWLGFKVWGSKFGGVVVIRLQKGQLKVVPDTLPSGSVAVEDVPLSVCWAATVERAFKGRPWREHPPIFNPAACLGLYGPKSKCPVWDTCMYGLVGL